MTDEDLQIAIDKTRAWISDVSSSEIQQRARTESSGHLRALEAEQLARARSGLGEFCAAVGGTE